MATLIQTLQHALSTKDPSLRSETKRIVLKEVLHAYLLDFLYNHPRYRRLNFYGGTCLHVIYELDRLSEDLDLDNSAEVDLSEIAAELQSYFLRVMGYPEAAIKSQWGRQGIRRIIVRLPVLNVLGLSPYPNEALHIKLEISHHKQVAVVKQTPVLYHGRSFVPSHFSLETMMAGKIIACLEREFRMGKSATLIKGRDFYDLLWFMQKGVQPLEGKLLSDGKKSYTTTSAMLALKEKIVTIRPVDLSGDLMPLFESGIYVNAWIEAFRDSFMEYLRHYVE